MIVAGFGFRSGASVAALREALARAGGTEGVTHLATVEGKAGGLAGLGRELGLPVVAVPDAALRGQATVTRSPRVVARFATGSLAEAAALAAAGPGARLRGPRAVSADGMATAAIAEGGA